MKTDRLFGIVYELLNGRSTAGELAARFGVSKRTILRDLETLSLAGVPVYTVSGSGGGVALLDGYVLDKAVLSDAEREQILTALKTLAPTGQTSALDKIDKMFSTSDTKNVVEVDFSRWGMPFDKEKYEAVRRAVASSHVMEFSYPDNEGNFVPRRVYPLKLVYKGRSWYVQAFCLLRNDYRTFKINRMDGIAVYDEKFDASMYSPPPIESERANCENVCITAAFAPAAASRVYDEFYPHEITKNTDGTLTVETSMPLNEWVYGYLMSFGDGIIRLEPRSLCEVIGKKVENMRKTYLKMT